MSRYRDFDAEAASDEPIRFKIAGREYEIPADPEADPILVLMAEGRLTDESATLELLDAIMGAENLARMRADKVGLRQLTALSMWLMQELGLVPTTDEEEGAGDGGDPEGNGSRSPTLSSIGER